MFLMSMILAVSTRTAAGTAGMRGMKSGKTDWYSNSHTRSTEKINEMNLEMEEDARKGKTLFPVKQLPVLPQFARAFGTGYVDQEGNFYVRATRTPEWGELLGVGGAFTYVGVYNWHGVEHMLIKVEDCVSHDKSKTVYSDYYVYNPHVKRVVNPKDTPDTTAEHWHLVATDSDKMPESKLFSLDSNVTRAPDATLTREIVTQSKWEKKVTSWDRKRKLWQGERRVNKVKYGKVTPDYLDN